MQVVKQQLELDVQQRTNSKLRNSQCYMLSPYLFNFYAEYIIRNARLDDSQAGIRVAGRNINSLRYAGDTTLITESAGEPKSLLMEVKEESEKVGLKLNTPTQLRSWHLDLRE